MIPHRTFRRLLAVMGLAVLLAALHAGAGRPSAAQAPDAGPIPQIDTGTLAGHVAALAVEIGARPAGSEAEALAATYIAQQFAGWGYDVTVQAFETTQHGAQLTSHNVIAAHPGNPTADLPGTIVIGAHLDSVSAGTGADDNASGVAVILAAAQALAGIDTRRPIVFVAFGAEEIGTKGSQHYVASLSDAERNALLAMINVDTVGIGDTFYVYAGAIPGGPAEHPFTPGLTWARDLALTTGAALGHDVHTTPPESWDGFIGPWSDHFPFVEQGVPIAYFERWNWTAGDDPLWGQETASAGSFLHTGRDIFENVDPALMLPVAETVTVMVQTLATSSTVDR